MCCMGQKGNIDLPGLAKAEPISMAQKSENPIPQDFTAETIAETIAERLYCTYHGQQAVTHVSRCPSMIESSTHNTRQT